MTWTGEPRAVVPLRTISADAGSGPLLVLLHGRSGTAEVWSDVLDLAATDWPGGVLAPDLAGHGDSGRRPGYGVSEFADDVIDLLPSSRRAVLIVGHSMGGVVGLDVAGRATGSRVLATLGLGIKLRWSEDEVAAAAVLAAKPPRVFATRAEAARRHLAVTGLGHLWASDDPRAEAGTRSSDNGWMLACDPRTLGLAAPEVDALLASAPGIVRLARGSEDPQVTLEELRALDPSAVDVPDAGHNVHVEQPGWVLELALDLLHATAGSTPA